MFESILNFFKRKRKNEDKKETSNSRDTAKERLHLVLMQDRANVSADFLELMKQEIIEVIKKYIEIDEGAIDVRLTNKENEDGTNGAPALYANIPILNIKHDMKKNVPNTDKDEKQEEPTKEDEKENENIEQKEPTKENKNSENSENTNFKDKSDNKIKEKTEKPKEQKSNNIAKEESNSNINNKNDDMDSEEANPDEEKKEVKSEKIN